jgi:hypothetical protein
MLLVMPEDVSIEWRRGMIRRDFIESNGHCVASHQ